MTVTCRLIARLLLAMLLFVAAPFSVGCERLVTPEVAVGAQAETGQIDTRIDPGDTDGQPRQDVPVGELQVTEADAQECALLVDGAWSATCVLAAAVDLAHLSVPSRVPAALDRPPRGW